MRSKFILNRRTFLRGSIAGIASTLALPPLEAMLNVNGDLFADGTPLPENLGVWFWGNGNRPDLWMPKGSYGHGNVWELSEELAPLLNVKEKINVLSNFAVKHTGTGHHRGRASILTGTYNPTRGTYGNPTGPSLSRIASRHWQGNDKTKSFRESFDAGIATQGKSTYLPSNGALVDEKGNFQSVERNPRTLFKYFFDNFTPKTNPEAEKAFKELRGSALNALMEDARGLRKRLGAADKERLDAHLAGFQTLEKDLDAYEKSVCELNIMNPADQKSFYRQGPVKEDLEGKNKLMSDMLVTALSCGLTRAFSIAFTTMQSDTVLWQIGATEGVHVMTHDDRGLDTKLAPQLNKVHQAVVFTMKNFAYLLERMEATKIGAVSLLDQSCIMATSELDDATRHTNANMPLILAGGGGGRLKTNNHVDGKGGIATQALLTALHGVGIEQKELGSTAGYTKSTLSDILI